MGQKHSNVAGKHYHLLAYRRFHICIKKGKTIRKMHIRPTQELNSRVQLCKGHQCSHAAVHQGLTLPSSWQIILTSASLLFPEAKSCEDIQCSMNKKCLWDSRVGRGRCATCDDTCPNSKSDEAVCASDNTTYPSECAMKQAACSLGILLEVKHNGSCNCK